MAAKFDSFAPDNVVLDSVVLLAVALDVVRWVAPNKAVYPTWPLLYQTAKALLRKSTLIPTLSKETSESCSIILGHRVSSRNLTGKVAFLTKTKLKKASPTSVDQPSVIKIGKVAR